MTRNTRDPQYTCAEEIAARLRRTPEAKPCRLAVGTQAPIPRVSEALSLAPLRMSGAVPARLTYLHDMVRNSLQGQLSP